MIYAFTGHRNRLADSRNFLALAERYPGALWLHGAALGFDTQVDDFARSLGIRCEVIRPRYKEIPAGIPPEIWVKLAPLKRNEGLILRVVAARMQSEGGGLVALWDGRETGGTYYTKRYAELWRIETQLWTPAEEPAP